MQTIENLKPDEITEVCAAELAFQYLEYATKTKTLGFLETMETPAAYLTVLRHAVLPEGGDFCRECELCQHENIRSRFIRA